MALALWLWAWRGPAGRPAVAGPGDSGALRRPGGGWPVLAQQLPLHLGRERKLDVVHGVYFAGLLLFGPPAGVALAGAGHLVGQATLALRRHPETGHPRARAGACCLTPGRCCSGRRWPAWPTRRRVLEAPAPLERPHNLGALPLAAGALDLTNSLLVAGWGLHGAPRCASAGRAWRAGRELDLLQFGAVYAVGVGLPRRALSLGGVGRRDRPGLPAAAGGDPRRAAAQVRLRAAQESGARLPAAGRAQQAFLRLAGHELRRP